MKSPNQFPVNPKSSWKHIKAHDKNLKIFLIYTLQKSCQPFIIFIFKKLHIIQLNLQKVQKSSWKFQLNEVT